MSELHSLSLGAGVQSTTVYLLAMEGKIHLDVAVFADTGDEPQAVYAHLAWLQALNGPKIHVASRGRLSDDLLRGENSTRQRIAAVPFFTMKPAHTVRTCIHCGLNHKLDATVCLNDECGMPLEAYATVDLPAELGMTRRQCSKEYKVEVVERCIKRTILGLKPRCRVPKSITIHQYFGISLDEARRTIGIKKRVPHPHFPLIELGWTRADCQRYLLDRVPHETPRSACVYCPFHSDAEWMRVRQNPEDWALAVKVDAGLRKPGAIVNRNMDAQMFAHRSCKPLDQVKFKHERQFNMFTTECEGMCGL